jgi:uncharacterized membrane protein YraQ (UPF0718 family)
MLILALVTAGAVIVSFIANWRKTLQGLKKGLALLLSLAFPFLTILIAVTVVLMFVNEETLARFISKESGVWAIAAAALLGSISLIPGFVAFPLCALLIKMGAAYSVVAVFLTTLMMVGVVTLPLEAKYFGWKAALLRNGLSFVAAIVIGLGVGLLWNAV